jgi:uncharacterized membrane protein YhaH (DUF805 family)
MIRAYRAFWVNSFRFAGKTSRADFWQAAAANTIALAIILIFGVAIVSIYGDSAAKTPIVLVIAYGVASFVPNISIQARRLRDGGFSPWLLLSCLLPYVGGIALLLMYLAPSRIMAHD